MIGGQSAPPLIAGMLPSNAANVTGNYYAAGMIGLGSAAADLSYAAPCNEPVKYPARITFDVKHYSGDGIKLFQMQIDSEEQQRLQDHKRDAERKRPTIAKPVTTESVPGGTIVYYDYSKSCTEVPGTRYVSYLAAVGHTPSTAIDMIVEGSIPGSTAKSVAAEVLKKFGQAKFD